MKKKCLSIIILLSLVGTALPGVNVFADTTPSTYGITYEGHVQNIGWQKPVTTTGDQYAQDMTNVPEAGTDGQGLRVEALKITGANLPQGASITYKAHVQNIGWMDSVTTIGNTDINAAPECGTDGKGLRVEAFKITLNGMPGYSIKYQTHVQNKGWMTPVETDNGTAIDAAAEAGTDGLGLRMEALRIEIVRTPVVATFTSGYVNNTNFNIDLNVRSLPSMSGTVLGTLYDYAKVQVLSTVTDTSGMAWDQINYNGSTGYVASSYIQTYTSPSDSAVTIASNITRQFEVGGGSEIIGSFDGQGLSLGYLQWCIGQGTLQPILNRMDREYNPEMKSIFGTNYTAMHAMIQDTSANQLKWAQSINDGSNNIIEPWRTQLVNLYKNADYISIENDAQNYYVRQAMFICNKYNLKTVRGFALSFDISVLDGSVSAAATQTIATAKTQNPNISEKDLLMVIANAVSTNPDGKSRETAIVNGQGTVHESMLYLDRDYGLSDNLY